jgi:hypothetical protein
MANHHHKLWQEDFSTEFNIRFRIATPTNSIRNNFPTHTLIRSQSVKHHTPPCPFLQITHYQFPAFRTVRCLLSSCQHRRTPETGCRLLPAYSTFRCKGGEGTRVCQGMTVSGQVHSAPQQYCLCTLVYSDQGKLPDMGWGMFLSAPSTKVPEQSNFVTWAQPVDFTCLCTCTTNGFCHVT